jgi:hypothetical protein
MKRLVRSDYASALMLGAIGGVIVGLTDASAAVTYLIAFALGAIGLGPEYVRLRRKTHGTRSSRRRRSLAGGRSG